MSEPRYSTHLRPEQMLAISEALEDAVNVGLQKAWHDSGGVKGQCPQRWFQIYAAQWLHRRGEREFQCAEGIDGSVPLPVIDDRPEQWLAEGTPVPDGDER